MRLHAERAGSTRNDYFLIEQGAQSIPNRLDSLHRASSNRGELRHLLSIHLAFRSDVGNSTEATINAFLALPLPYFMINAAILRTCRKRRPIDLDEKPAPHRRYP